MCGVIVTAWHAHVSALHPGEGVSVCGQASSSYCKDSVTK